MNSNKERGGRNKLVDKVGNKKNKWWGYVRVSTDLQDIGKQKDIIKNWLRREGVKDYEIIQGGMISSTKDKAARKLEFIDDWKVGCFGMFGDFQIVKVGIWTVGDNG